MKTLLCSLLVIAFTLNSFAAPLIYKATREITESKSGEFVEISRVDVSKYKKIRIGVLFIKGTPQRLGNWVNVEAVEDEDLIFLTNFNVDKSKSIALDNLPQKIRLSVSGNGTYQIYIWGE